METTNFDINQQDYFPPSHSSFVNERNIQKKSTSFSQSLNNFQCSHCGLMFHDVITLRSHITSNHFSVSCKLCGKGYQTPRGLAHHMQSHKGKTFMCPVCDAKFTHKFSIKSHLRTVHKSARCVACYAVFKLGNEYDQHVLYCGQISGMEYPS